LTKITQATTIDALAEIGQYITINKDSYNPELLEQFRAKFTAQQANLIVPKLETQEETQDDATAESTTVTV
jgi:hypothetical protein